MQSGKIPSSDSSIDDDHWWIIEYSNHVEAIDAAEYLKTKDIPVSTIDPQEKSPRAPSGGREHCIDMTVLTNAKQTPQSGKEPLLPNNNPTATGSKIPKPVDDNVSGHNAVTWSAEKSTKSESFFSLFRKYPKTALNFPVLLWLLLLILVILIPVPLALHSNLVSTSILGYCFV